MSLEKYRDLLRVRLNLGTAFKTANQAQTMRTVEDWWAFYKAWEASDTFLGAFKEGRMTVRQIPSPKDMEKLPIGDIEDFDITYGNYNGKTSDVPFGVHRGPAEGVPYPEERYRVGTKAFKERFDPSKFGIDGGERLKYKHGLHDLSASLCVPSIPLLTSQVRWKWGQLSVRITVFMPLAKQEDMYLFYLLNAAAKMARKDCPQIYLQIAEMRKRMTRIKLADSEDIGAGLRDVSAPGSNVTKLRYGAKGEPDGIDRKRLQNALSYTSILPPAVKAPVTPARPAGRLAPLPPGGPPPAPGPPPPPPPLSLGKGDGSTLSCNEVVIAYREHAGDRFPLFTKYDVHRQVFQCHPKEPGSERIVNMQIPDRWVTTLEA